MHQRSYVLSGAPVRIRFQDEDQLLGLTHILDEIGELGSDDTGFVLTIERNDGFSPPAEAKLIHTGPLSTGIDAQSHMYLAPQREWLVAAPHGSVDVDWSQASATVRHTPGGSRGVQASLNLFGLEVALFHRKQLMLHGAGLLRPATGDVVVICAPSGYGKTTATLAIALAGWPILADDALMLKPTDGGLKVWGLPRSMKVHWRTLELLPALQPLLSDTWDANGEQELKRDAFAAIGPIAPPGDHDIGAVLVIDERTDGPHKVVPLAKSEALIAISNDNLGRSSFGHGVPSRHVRKMEGFSRLVSSVPAAKLHVGRPLESLAAAIDDFVAAARRP